MKPKITNASIGRRKDREASRIMRAIAAAHRAWKRKKKDI